MKCLDGINQQTLLLGNLLKICQSTVIESTDIGTSQPILTCHLENDIHTGGQQCLSCDGLE